ncbi:MAG: S8 family serine peptidase [Planctomycetota bacterium]|nr:S8 family serine peptidase [Planctomycetota bacterium]MDP6940654.1 S8 family serine peptidase [Planctomycetota bacterium]
MIHAILLPFLAFPAAQAPTQLYQEIPGVKEFSGRLTVRPSQEEAVDHIHPEWIREFVADTNEYILNIPASHDENSLSAELMATGLFEYAEPDWWVYTIGTTPNDPKFSQQWHHSKMNSTIAWDYGTGDGSFIACTVDTGVNTGHEDLSASMVPGYNSASNQSQANGGDVSDVHGHGTNTIGCVGAIGDNSKGVVGMAWDIKLMPVRCTNFSSGVAYMSDITDGARWASDNGARVIGASWSGVDSSTVGTTGTHVRGEGSILVWAAGNDGRQINGYDHTDVVVTAATKNNDTRTSWSNYGNIVDCAVPGDGIWTTSRSGGYSSVSGTSFSCPIAVGVLAMMMQTAPNLSADAIEQMMYDNCKDLGSSGDDIYYGAGRPEFDLCMEAAFLNGGGSGGADSITLTGPTGLIKGFTASFDFTRAAPNSLVHLLYSTSNTGVTLFGHNFEIGNPWGVVTSSQADSSGQGTLSSLVPPSAPSGTYYLECAVNDNGTISDSNLMTVTVF